MTKLRDILETDAHNKPLASPGFDSYRYKGKYGWIMLAAKSTEEALKEAKRSTTGNVDVSSLQKWDKDAKEYVDVSPK